MIQAPTTGDVVKVSGIGKPTSIRRIFEDSAFGTIATPSGGTATSYGGSRYDPASKSYQPPWGGGSTITRQPSYSTGLKRPSAY
jgi:hypothetical protein